MPAIFFPASGNLPSHLQSVCGGQEILSGILCTRQCLSTPPKSRFDGLSTFWRRFIRCFVTLSWEGVRQASALLLDTYRQTFGAFSRSNFLFVRRFIRRFSQFFVGLKIRTPFCSTPLHPFKGLQRSCLKINSKSIVSIISCLDTIFNPSISIIMLGLCLGLLYLPCCFSILKIVGLI